jgi:hypothetical protein
MSTPNLQLPYVLESQSAKEIPYNRGLVILDDFLASLESSLMLNVVLWANAYEGVPYQVTAALKEYNAESAAIIRAKADVSSYNQVRIVAHNQTDSTGGTLRAQKSSDDTAWGYWTAGSSNPSVALNATGVLVSSWRDLSAAGAKADNFMRLITDGGNDTFTFISYAALQFRK